MKLIELFLNPPEISEPNTDDGNLVSQTAPIRDTGGVKHRTARGSNVDKAKKIAAKAKQKSRAANSEHDDTPHQSHLGGHGSAFLFR